MAVTIGDLVARLRLDASRFRADMQRVESTLRRTSENFKRIGGDLTRFVTLPIAGIAIAAIKATTSFETAMVGVAKTIDAPADAIKELGRQFVELSEDIPVAANRLANIAQIGGQLGVAIKDMLKFTRVIADMGAAARDLTAEEAALSLTRLAGLTGVLIPDLDRLGSSVAELGNKLKTSEKPILEMAIRLAAVSKAIGLTGAETVGLAGALSELGIRARAGGTAMSDAFIRIASAVEEGTEELAEFARVAGLTAPEFAKLFKEDAAEALILFVEGLGRLISSGEGAFGVLEDLGLTSAQLRRAFLSAAASSGRMRRAVELSTNAFEENTALTKEAERFYARLGGQFEILGNKAVNIAAEFGDRLRPAIDTIIHATDQFLDRIRKLVVAFGKLAPETQNQIVLAAGLAAALGPLAIILGGLLSIFGGLIGTITLMSGGMAALAIIVVALSGDWRVFRDAAVGALQAVTGELPSLGQASEAVSRTVSTVLAVVRRQFGMLFKDLGEGFVEIGREINKLATLIDKIRDFVPRSDLRAAEKALGSIEAKIKALIALRANLAAGRRLEPGLDTSLFLQNLGLATQSLEAVDKRLGELRIEAALGERVVASLGRQLGETADTDFSRLAGAATGVGVALTDLSARLLTAKDQTAATGKAIAATAKEVEGAFKTMTAIPRVGRLQIFDRGGGGLGALAEFNGLVNRARDSIDGMANSVRTSGVDNFLRDIGVLADENLGEAIFLLHEMGKGADEMAAILEIDVERVRDAMKQLGIETQSTLVASFKTAGQAAASSLIDGIIDGTLKAEDFLKNFLKALFRIAIFSAFGIGSPSKLGISAGESLSEGVARGIAMRANLIGTALRNTASNLRGVFDRVAVMFESPDRRAVEQLLDEVNAMIEPLRVPVAVEVGDRQGIDQLLADINKVAQPLADVGGAAVGVGRVPVAVPIAPEAPGAMPSITVNADFSQIPQPTTPDAIALNAAWQRVFSETFRQLRFGGFQP